MSINTGDNRGAIQPAPQAVQLIEYASEGWRKLGRILDEGQ